MFLIDDLIKGGVEGTLGKVNDLIKTFKLSPEDALKWETEKERISQETKLRLSENANKRFEQEVKDRDSARQREVAVKDNTPRILAFVVVGGFLGVSVGEIITLFFWPEMTTKMSPQGWVLIGNISGYLAAKSELALSYYFGTSSGEQHKTELLAKAEPIK